jgi:hypothetical protein
MKHIVTLAALSLIMGCTLQQQPAAAEYRQPWTVYKTRADIVPQQPIDHE